MQKNVSGTDRVMTVVAVIILVALGGAAIFFTQSLPESYRFFDENAHYETLQIAVMALGAFLWALLTVRLWKTIWREGEIHVSISAFFTLLCVVVVFRETSFLGVYGVGDGVQAFTETLVVSVAVLTVLGLAVFWFRNRARALSIFGGLRRQVSTYWALVSLVLVLSSDIFEKRLFHMPGDIVWEETLELMGYIAICVAAALGLSAAFRRDLQQPKHQRPQETTRGTIAPSSK